ncbi:MAG: sigma-70 family RNA polymerase sigma factor [Oscillospiraceae bacterium]
MQKQDVGALCEKYERLVYTICYQFTKNHSTAEDLTQETFISAFSHIDTCPKGAEKPWLARIATNKAKDYLKSAYNRRVSATEDEALDTAQNTIAFAPAPEDITIEKDTVKRIHEEIYSLKEPYRLVSEMFFINERSVEEISRALERPPKTVHTQLYRAKQILREKIEGGKLNGII